MIFPVRSCRFTVAIAVVLNIVFVCPAGYPQADQLASWNNGAAKRSILSLVKHVTDKSGSQCVEPPRPHSNFRDGTLGTEHPIYTQAAFAPYRVRELGPKHPEWREREPFKAVIAGDREAMSKFSEADWEVIVATTQTGITTDAFLMIVKQSLAMATDPRFRRHYTELVYQPMLEVMNYLRANGFKLYIVTGGGQEFVRAYSQRVYGVPPEEIVGSAF